MAALCSHKLMQTFEGVWDNSKMQVYVNHKPKTLESSSEISGIRARELYCGFITNNVIQYGDRNYRAFFPRQTLLDFWKHNEYNLIILKKVT